MIESVRKRHSFIKLVKPVGLVAQHGDNQPFRPEFIDNLNHFRPDNEAFKYYFSQFLIAAISACQFPEFIPPRTLVRHSYNIAAGLVDQRNSGIKESVRILAVLYR